MEKYSKEHHAFFDAIQDIESGITGAIENPSLRTVIRAAKIVKKPSKFPKAILSYEVIKHASADIPEDINPIRLKNFLVDNYKADWLEWLPAVIDKEVMGKQKSEILSNKIQAIRVCLNTDTPWLQWHVFEDVGKALNHQVPDFTLVQPLTLGECLTTMDTMKKLRSEEEFSSEVLAYIASIAANNDYVYLPSEWEVGKAQPILRGFIHDASLELKVERAWGKLSDKKLLEAKFSEDDSVHRQLAKLALVQQYYREFVE